MTDEITVPYDPDHCIGDWGFIWSGDPEDEDEAAHEGEWLLVATTEDERKLLVTDVYQCDGIRTDTRGRWAAENLRGRPYLPLCRPACEPGAGLLVTIRLPKAASLAHSWGRPCPEADRARKRVIAALSPNSLEGSDADLVR